MIVTRHAGQFAVDAGHQAFADIGVMERKQVADRALRPAEMEIDGARAPVGQTGRKFPKCSCYRHRHNLIAFLLIGICLKCGPV
ncbi:hypothetical protein [Burkholderia sp. USMB20]|uniref:hypothetical protein n=2 Tax=unclassified Burkholderia TaxID=2613784 RepID=UPI001F2F384B|nr:hypothetical protein [Burkholderia sp. USMB20]